MKCHLHIGTAKTGTTTIQRFLAMNSKVLQKVGLSTVPETCTSKKQMNSRLLSIASFDSDRRDDWTRRHGIDSDQDLRQEQSEIRKSITQAIHALDSPSVVLSGEHMHMRLTRPSEISRLKELLQSAGCTEFLVHIYLRHQASYRYSQIAESIKNGDVHKTIDLRDPATYRPTFHESYDYAASLQRWSDVFGAASIKPRIFENSSFHNGSLIDDFSSALGLPNTMEYKVPHEENVKLSREALEILNRINSLIPRWINDRPNPARQHWKIPQTVAKKYNSGKHECSPAMFEAWDSYYKEINDNVCANWFPARPCLFNKRPLSAESEMPSSQDRYDEIAQTIARIHLSSTKQPLE